MSEERGKDSLSQMSLSEKHSVRSGSHVSSSVSLKSDQSKGHVPNFSEKTPSSNKSVRSGSHVSSSVSLKSDQSKGHVPDFSEKTPSSNKRYFMSFTFFCHTLTVFKSCISEYQS
ncbi:hypothetical protein PO909_030160 [Leuciscus waleckii]